MFRYWLVDDGITIVAIEDGMKPLLERGRDDKDKAVLLGLGVTLAVSLAGYLVFCFTRRNSISTLAGYGSRTGSKTAVVSTIISGRGLKDELCLLQQEQEGKALANVIHSISRNLCTTTTSAVTSDVITEQSSGVKSPEDGDVTSSQEIDQPSVPELEEEFVHLTNLVRRLWKKERNNEIQLLENRGLEERETTVGELKHLLQICSMAAKSLSVKLEFLQLESQRLKVVASPSSGTMRELRSAKLKIKHLKKRLRSCRAQGGTQMNSLQHRIAMLQNKVDQDEQIDADVQIKLQRLEDLEDEADDLRKATSILAQTLESAQVSQAEGFEEVKILRESNHKLEKRIEQLQTDHHAEVEELVLLRWLNSRLIYELAYNQLPPVKPAEKDPRNCRRPKHDAEDRRSSTSDVILSSCKPKLFLGKLKKLVRRRGSQSNNDISESCITFETRAAASTCSGDPTSSGLANPLTLTGAKPDDTERWQNNSA
ncbi:protein CHUP1, chloroplastic-like [Musa acuminata AAA Group]|uniref:protein CHUP1, chloroplastic n=1 Tax=Musa acuminata AAA Group TaxID=214697 RepID=UPI0031D4BAAC